MNISAKFQLHPSYGFWGDDISPQIQPFGCHVNSSNSAVLDKINNMLGIGLFKEHFCKTFAKIFAVG